MKEGILGYDVDTLSVSECVDHIVREMASGKRRRWLACLNPHSFVVSTKDNEFASALKDADLLIPDGVGIVLASKILGGDIRQRVTGPEVFSSLLQRLDASQHTRVFFMGSTRATLDRIEARIHRDHPNLEVVGTYSPPFRAVYSADETDEMVTAINAADPDVLLVGLTAPKQEKWIFENKARLNVEFIGAAGAMFDYFAGTVKTPSPIWVKLGLQFVHRLAQHPLRLWRRTFISAPVFVLHVMRARLAAVRT